MPKVEKTERSTKPVIEYTGVDIVISVGLTILKLGILAPPNVILVILIKLVPVIVTNVPPVLGPFVGEIEYSVGIVDDGKNS